MEIKNHKLGVIIPYRDRKNHLHTLLSKLQTHLVKQNIEFEIIIVEQYDYKSFNRGKLLNIGYEKAVELNCDYIAFHDVDMIPLIADYSYVDRPTHLATDFKSRESTTRTISDDYFGGVTLFPIEDFKKINGYSNKYFGWGYEDDDLLYRYRINFDDHNTKRIPIHISDSVGLRFNGWDSYVKIPKNFKLKNYTVLMTFKPDEISLSNDNEIDEYSIFTIPGYDTSITYNSFKRYKFETWNRRKKVLTLNSDISDIKQTTIIATVNQDDNIIKMFQDGNLLDTLEFNRKLFSYDEEEFMYLGKYGNEFVNRKFFKGTISYFSLWNHSVEETQIESMFKNLHMGMTEKYDGYIAPHCLEVCYDMRASTNKTIFDLSGNERHGEVYHCDRIGMEQPNPYKEIIVPWRKKSKFELLSHEENGYVDNKWKHPETRKNQLRFHNEVLTGNVDISKDGLSSLRYRLQSEETKDKVIHIKVKL